MSTDFQISALDRALFSEVLSLSNEELAARSIVRTQVDVCPGYPCRVSLTDLPVGSEALLLNYEHLNEDTPYRAAGGIFVGLDSETAKPAPNEIPPMLSRRLLSVRGFSEDHMLVSAEVVPGEQLAEQIRQFFDDEAVAYQHVHMARQGCYACRVDRLE